MNVGFIGLGRMGQGMAQRILSGGHSLAVHDAVKLFLNGSGDGSGHAFAHADLVD